MAYQTRSNRRTETFFSWLRRQMDREKPFINAGEIAPDISCFHKGITERKPFQRGQ